MRSVKPGRLLLFALAPALGLVTTFSVFRAAPAQAQAVDTSYISISTDQTSVYEGALGTFMVMRSNGSLADSLTVKVRTWEPNHGGDVPGFNTTELYHDVTFAPGSNVATVQVVAKQDVRIDPPVDTSNPWPHTLNAEVAAATDSSYELGTPSSAFIAIVDINATPYPLPLITIQNSGTPLAVTEGNDATFTLSRTGGDLTQPQTVGIRVDDPEGVDFLRGNHWDTAWRKPTPTPWSLSFPRPWSSQPTSPARP